MVPQSVAAASVVLLLARACLAAQSQQDQPLTLAVGEVTQCADFLKMPMRATNIHLRVNYTNGDMFMNSTIILDQALNDPITLRFEFYKCVTKEVASCSLQNTWERKTICTDLSKQGMVWSPILAKMKGLEPKCPIPAGTYKLIEGPITRAVRENLPMNQGHWRFKGTLIKNGKTVGCQQGYGEVKPKRRSRG